MLSYFYLVIGLLLVIKSADWLVNGASSIARNMRISDYIIGLTVVSFGTSLPELVISLVAGSGGNSDLILGNIIGSNIANILLVLGVASMIYPLSATNRTVWREIPFTLGACLVLVFLVNDTALFHEHTSQISRKDGLILLGCFTLFLWYAYGILKKQQGEDVEWVGELEQHNRTRSILEIVGGAFGLYVGGRLAVMMGAVPIAESWGMSTAFIGLTVLAIGTSLPELATSAVAAYRRNTDIAVGNVVGSNIFNIFIVLGISGTVRPIPFQPVMNADLAMVVFSTVLLFIFMFVGHPARTIQRREGALFVTLYLAYILYITNRG